MICDNIYNVIDADDRQSLSTPYWLSAERSASRIYKRIVILCKFHNLKLIENE